MTYSNACENIMEQDESVAREQEAIKQGSKQVKASKLPKCQEEQSCTEAVKYQPPHFLLEGGWNQLPH